MPPEKVHAVSDEDEFVDEDDLRFDDNQVVTVPGFVEVCSSNVEYLPITYNDKVL